MKDFSDYNKAAIDNPNVDIVRLVKITLDAATLYLCDRQFGTNNTFDGQVYEPLIESLGSVENGKINPANYTVEPSMFDFILNNNTPIGGAERFTSLFVANPPHYGDILYSEIYWPRSSALVGDGVELWDAAASVFTSGTYAWVALSSNTIANVGNELEITYVNHTLGAQEAFSDAADLNSNLTIGDNYRLNIDSYYTGGASGVFLRVWDGSGYGASSPPLTNSKTRYTLDFIANSTTGCFTRLSSMSASNKVYIDNLSLQKMALYTPTSADRVDKFKGKIEDILNMSIDDVTVACSGFELDIQNKYEHEILATETFPKAEIADVGKMLPQIYGSPRNVRLLGLEVGMVTTLPEGIDDAVTDIEVSETYNFESSGEVVIDDEKITYDSLSEISGKYYLIDCTRGFDDTIAAAHLKEAVVQEIPTQLVYGVGHPIKAWGSVYVTDFATGILIKKIVNEDYSTYTGQAGSQLNGFGARAVVAFDKSADVPSGVIIPFKGSSTPTGWAAFSSANNRFLIGAGNLYAAGATGGSSALSGTSDENSHGLGPNYLFSALGTGAVVTTNGWPLNTGAVVLHDHDIDFTFEPEYQDLKFIKASSAQDDFPADAVVLSYGNSNPDPQLLSAIYTDNDYLRADTAVATGGGSYSGLTVSTTIDHIHQTELRADPLSVTGTPRDKVYESGGHTHPTLASFDITTDDIKRAYLSAWSALTDFHLHRGMIAMWESAVPPDGWAICDGTGDTPDLRDYFIKLSSSGNSGTVVDGANQITFDLETSTDGDHTHESATGGAGNWLNGVLHDNSGADDYDHAHEMTDPVDCTPPYYALYFIIKEQGSFDDTQTHQIVADIDGFQDDSSGTYTGTPSALIDQPDQICKHILIDRCGLTSSEIDASSYAESAAKYLTEGYVLGPVIQTKPNPWQLLNRLAIQAKSIETWEAGKHRLIYVNDIETVDKYIDPHRINLNQIYLSYTDRSSLRNTLTGIYDRDWSGKSDNDAISEQEIVKAIDSASITKYGVIEGDGYSFPYIIEGASAQAQDVLNWKRDDLGDVRLVIEFAGGYNLSDLERGDVIAFRDELNVPSGMIGFLLKEDGDVILKEDGYALELDLPVIPYTPSQYLDDATLGLITFETDLFRVIDFVDRPDAAKQVQAIKI